MRTPLMGLGTRILTAVIVLNLAGSEAAADPMYQVTDLGLDGNGNPSSSTTSNALSESELRPVRIDANGQVTNGAMGPFDLSQLSAIQAPYAVGNANLFPAIGGSSYQAGWIRGPDSRDSWQALIWNGQSGMALGTAPPAFGEPGFGTASVANGVNDAGHAVGAVGNANLQSETAVTWGLSPNGGDPLAPLHAQLGSYSEAFGINAHDQIVGTFGSYTNPHAFLFTGDQLLDLNSLTPANSGWTLLSATGINDQGQIVGYGIGPGGNLHQFLLTPDSGSSPSAS